MNKEIPDTPRVSCLLTAGENPPFAARAIFCFQQQTWTNKELVVMDTSSGDLAPLLDDIPDRELCYSVIQNRGKHTYASLMNRCMDLSTGDFLIHWHEEDWHHPERIAYQAEVLLHGYELCWLHSTLVHFDHPEFIYHPYTSTPRGGYPGSMMYRKKESRPFEDKKNLSDRKFLARWSESEKKLMDPSFAWLLVRIASGKTRSREYKRFLRGLRNCSKDIAELAWLKLRGKNLVSHSRFKLSVEAKKSFQLYMKESRKLGLIRSLS